MLVVSMSAMLVVLVVCCALLFQGLGFILLKSFCRFGISVSLKRFSVKGAVG